MRATLRHWCTAFDAPPAVGTLLRLEELNPDGGPTGRHVLARVEASPDGAEGPRRPSSTQRLFAVDVPPDCPHMCRCGHVRVLHQLPPNPTDPRGPCSLCPPDACPAYRPTDPREEP